MKKLASLVALLLLTLSVGFAQAESIKCTWDANTETDLAGYRLFMRSETQSYDYADPIWEGAATETSEIDVTTWMDGTYYFVVRAFDESGNESGDSNEVSYRVDHTAPAPPAGCQVIRVP